MARLRHKYVGRFEVPMRYPVSMQVFQGKHEFGNNELGALKI